MLIATTFTRRVFKNSCCQNKEFYCGYLQSLVPVRSVSRPRCTGRPRALVHAAELDFDHKPRKRTLGREWLHRSNLCAAKKCRILINYHPGRFHVTTQCATGLKLAAFSHENIALHRASHLHRFRPDLTAYARVLPKRERSVGIDCALHVAVDEQLVQEFDRAFDRSSSGEKIAGLRWHERAFGWPWDDRWSGRFICVGCGFGLSSEHVHSVIPPGHREI